MIAKMKCSNCGAEMSNLNMSWGWKQLVFMLPVMLIGFYPLAKMTLWKADVTKELVVSDITKRSNGDNFEVLGLIKNQGKHNWSSVTVKAEFFDAAGTFIDEASEYLRSDIAAGAEDHFKMSFRSAEPKVRADNTKMVVKVTGGHTMPF